MIVTVAGQGYQLIANVTTEPSVENRPRWQRAATFGGLGLVLLLGTSIAWTRLRREATPTDVVRLAVLPFDNLTGDSSRNYLADGLTEELITHLARATEAYQIAGYMHSAAKPIARSHGSIGGMPSAIRGLGWSRSIRSWRSSTAIRDTRRS